MFMYSQTWATGGLPVALTEHLKMIPQPLTGKEDCEPEEEIQLQIFKSSIANGLQLLTLLEKEVKEDFLGGVTIQIIREALSKRDVDLTDNLLKIHMKYDALFQALGQALGNLQDYETLTFFSQYPLLLTDFQTLHDYVPLLKDYRSSRTHYGYTNIHFVGEFMRGIEKLVKKGSQELIALHHTVQKMYTHQSISFDGMYPSQDQPPVSTCKLS